MRRKANVDGAHFHTGNMDSAHSDEGRKESAGGLPLVVAVVLNYRDPPTTLKCVSSILASTYQRMSVVVVDNSSDDSLISEMKRFDGRCVYKDSGENLGYAGGNNAGFEIAFSMGADYVLALNNDTVVDPNAVEFLVRAAERSNHKIGALFPKVLQGGQSCAGGRLRRDGWTVHVLDDGHLHADENGLHGPLDWVPGVAMFFSRRSLEDVGPFDDRLFFYYEDVEWSLRARSRGYLLYSCLNALVFHEHSRTFGSSSAKFRTYYPLRNEVATALRWFPTGMKCLAMIRILMNSAMNSYEHVLRRRPELVRVTVKAIADGLFGRLGREYVPMED